MKLSLHGLANTAREYAHWLLIAAAIGTLLYVRFWLRLFLLSGEIEYYVKSLTLSRAIGATAINSFLAASAVLAIVLLSRRFASRRTSDAIHWGMLILLGLLLFRFILSAVPLTTEWVHPIPNWPLVFSAAAIAMLLVSRSRNLQSKLATASRLAWQASVVTGVVFLMNLAPLYSLMGWPDPVQFAPDEQHGIPSPSQAQVQANAGAVWIVFDEMDASLAFENRPEGLRMPNLDRFRDISASFTRAQSVHEMTMVSVPAILTGTRFREVAGKSEHDLTLLQDGSDSRHSFRETPNVLSTAAEAGHPVSLIGWLHPYCRMFGSFLNVCHWEDFHRATPSASWAAAMQEQSLAKGVLLEMATAAGVGSSDRCPDGSAIDRLTNADYVAYGRHMARIVETQRGKVKEFLRLQPGGLHFFHLATPHPPGTQEEAEAGGIFRLSIRDNFKIADQIFGEIRQILEDQGTWDSRLVIVTSDHGMRSHIWEHWGCNSPDDIDLLSRSGSTHVPILVKWPHEERPVTIDWEVSNIWLAPAVSAYMKGEVAALDGFLSFAKREAGGSSQSSQGAEGE